MAYGYVLPPSAIREHNPHVALWNDQEAVMSITHICSFPWIRSTINLPIKRTFHHRSIPLHCRYTARYIHARHTAKTTHTATRAWIRYGPSSARMSMPVWSRNSTAASVASITNPMIVAQQPAYSVRAALPRMHAVLELLMIDRMRWHLL